MVLMGMGEDRGANRSILHLLQDWRRVMADLLGIHAAVENHGTLRKVEAITVGTDPGTPRQIRKTHVRGVYENGIRTREGNFDSARLSDDLREILKTSNHTATFHR
jgi:hypothetical protein